MRLILDAGAFVAVERLDRDIIAVIKHELIEGRTPLTHGGIIGQVWRGGGTGRQANLSRFVSAVEITPLDESLGRRAGLLLGRSRRKDVIDAALVLLASDGDLVLTSDPQDLQPLASFAGLDIDIANLG